MPLPKFFPKTRQIIAGMVKSNEIMLRTYESKLQQLQTAFETLRQQNMEMIEYLNKMNKRLEKTDKHYDALPPLKVTEK